MNFPLYKSVVRITWLEFLALVGYWWRAFGFLAAAISPTIRYGIAGQRSAQILLGRNVQDIDMLGQQFRLLSLRFQLGGFHPTPIYPLLVILAVIIMLGGIYCALFSILLVGIESGFRSQLAIMAITLLSLPLMWVVHQDWFIKSSRKRWYAGSVLFLFAGLLLGYVTYGFQTSAVIVGLLGSSILLVLGMVLFYRRDVGQIFLILLNPGNSFPILKPLAKKDGRTVFMALRLLSPSQRYHYVGVENIDETIWVPDNKSAFDTASNTSNWLCGQEQAKLDQNVKDDLWYICRYAVRQYMEGNETLREVGRSQFIPRKRRSDGLAAYFTAKLHLTQIKAYAVLIVLILASAWIYAVEHPTHANVHDRAKCNHATPNDCIEPQFYEKAIHRLEVDEESKNLKQLPMVFVGLGIVWVVVSMFYRRRQLERLTAWEYRHRQFNNTGGLQLFEFVPEENIPGNRSWLEVIPEEITAPVEKFGLTHERVFHLLDGVLLVLLMEILHILHF